MSGGDATGGGAPGGPPVAAAPAAAPSAWAPLRRSGYRTLWLGALASNVATAVQGATSGWDMTTLAGDPLLVALLSSAASLPVLLVGLPAAALGDLFDRRRLLLGYTAWMALVSAVLAALAFTGAQTAGSLLGLTFALGLGAALAAPLWQASLPAEVEAAELGAAVTLSGVAINLARAAGPAAAGVGLALVGSGPVYALDAALFGVTAIQLQRWRPRGARSALPPERVVGAIVAGLRYARHAPALQAVLVRAAVFILAGSAMWALLPLVVGGSLGLSSLHFGLALGCVGVGALAGATFMPRLRARLGADPLFAAAAVLYAAAMAGLAVAPNAAALYAVMLAAGLAWIALMSGLNVAAASAAPTWVSARALGLYLLVLQGCQAIGAFAWGAVASEIGVSRALQLAAGAVAVGLAGGLRYRLAAARKAEVAAWQAWPEAPAVPALAAEPDAGPVWIQRAYRVPPDRAAEFLALARRLEAVRRRDGALAWAMTQDVAAPERFVELFEVASWAEHLRQHHRAVAADQPLIDALAPFTAEPAAHLVDAYAAARAREHGVVLAE